MKNLIILIVLLLPIEAHAQQVLPDGSTVTKVDNSTIGLTATKNVPVQEIKDKITLLTQEIQQAQNFITDTTKEIQGLQSQLDAGFAVGVNQAK